MTTTNNNYCSISTTKNNGSCYSRESLLTLINSYNKIHANKIIVKPNSSIKILWSSLNNKMKKYCKNGEEWFWTDILRIKTKDYEDKIKLKLIEKKELKPSQPTEWVKNPNEWLSNYDIMNVMKQYEAAEPTFQFIGPVPIDFDEKQSFGSCIVDELCKLDLNSVNRKGITKIGIVFNLDKHDEPGSHWVCAFIDIDAKAAYYFDSYGYEPENEIVRLLERCKQQGCTKIYYNDIRHQRKGSECGMYCLYLYGRNSNRRNTILSVSAL
jgi:hypothetical protein